MWQREGHIGLPSYRGHCTIQSDPVEEPEKWFLPIMDVTDTTAPVDEDQKKEVVRYSLIETCFTGLMIENKVLLRYRLWGEGGGEWNGLSDEVVREIGAMGTIAGDERWVIGQNRTLEVVVGRFQ